MSDKYPQSLTLSESQAQVVRSRQQFTDEEIRVAFQTFDLDKNMFVGVSEIRHILSILGERATDEEVDEMIRMCDVDGSGQVTYDGFYRLFSSNPDEVRVVDAPQYVASLPGAVDVQAVGGPIYGGSEMEDASHMPLESVMERFTSGKKLKPAYIKRVYKKFQMVDRNKTGKIGYREFLDVLDMDDSVLLQRMFDLFDTQRIQQIELKSFIVTLSNYTSANKTDKIKFSFLIYDEDGKGSIVRKTLAELLQSNFHNLAKDDVELRVDEVLEAAGINSDDPNAKITYEQFMLVARHNASLLFPANQVSHRLTTTQSIDAKLRTAHSDE